MARGRDPSRGPLGTLEEGLKYPYHRTFVGLSKRPDVGLGAKYAYGVLVSYLNVFGEYLGHRMLAEDMGISERSARRYMKDLVDAGLLSVRRRGQGLPNEYTMLAWTDQMRAAKLADLADRMSRPERTDRPLTPIRRTREEGGYKNRPARPMQTLDEVRAEAERWGR